MRDTFILILLIAVASFFMITGCAERTTPSSSEFNNSVFELDVYGGFTSRDNARNLMTIDSSKITYTVYTVDGNITLKFEKPISKESYDKIKKVFLDNDFPDFKEKYTLPQGVIIMDAGNAKITMTSDNYEKIVLIQPYVSDYLPDNVKKVVGEMQLVMNNIFNMNENELKSSSENWIAKSPTYSYDGSGLEFINYTILETAPETYEINYKFISASGGYGDRSNQMVIQVLIDHTITLRITKGKVISAVIDNKWDELNQVELGYSQIQFRPLQCEKNPWRKWYEEGNIQYVKEPVEEQLVIDYYAQKYNIEIRDFNLITESKVVTALCGSPESYYYAANISNSNKKQMVSLGWKE